MKQKFFLVAVFALLLTRTDNVLATVMISNLDQLWTSGGMGNFETVTPGYGHGFMFGTGANPYILDTVTLEELGGPGSVQVQLYAVQGDPLASRNPNLVLAGNLGNPAVDPRPTQWPTTTSFIDYTPVTSITLEPHTYYLITATEPVNGNDDTALTFNFNYSYTVSGDWAVDQSVTAYWTYYGSNPPPALLNGWMPDDYSGSMMIEVDATSVPEPSSCVLLLLCCALLGIRGFHCGALTRSRGCAKCADLN